MLISVFRLPSSQSPIVPLEDFTSDETEDVPEVELVYPARGFRERFALLQPRHSNEYHPIQEILNSIGLMVDRKSMHSESR